MAFTLTNNKRQIAIVRISALTIDIIKSTAHMHTHQNILHYITCQFNKQNTKYSVHVQPLENEGSNIANILYI